MHKLIAVALSYMLSNLDDVNAATGNDFKEEDVQMLLAAFRKSSGWPIHFSFNPDPQEMMNRLAVHTLDENGGKDEDAMVILVANAEHSVFLGAVLPPDMDDAGIIEGKTVVTPRPAGTVEDMVCDGLPAGRAKDQ